MGSKKISEQFLNEFFGGDLPFNTPDQITGTGISQGTSSSSISSDVLQCNNSEEKNNHQSHSDCQNCGNHCDNNENDLIESLPKEAELHYNEARLGIEKEVLKQVYENFNCMEDIGR